MILLRVQVNQHVICYSLINLLSLKGGLPLLRFFLRVQVNRQESMLLFNQSFQPKRRLAIFNQSFQPKRRLAIFNQSFQPKRRLTIFNFIYLHVAKATAETAPWNWVHRCSLLQVCKATRLWWAIIFHFTHPSSPKGGLLFLFCAQQKQL